MIFDSLDVNGDWFCSKCTGYKEFGHFEGCRKAKVLRDDVQQNFLNLIETYGGLLSKARFTDLKDSMKNFKDAVDEGKDENL